MKNETFDFETMMNELTELGISPCTESNEKPKLAERHSFDLAEIDREVDEIMRSVGLE